MSLPGADEDEPVTEPPISVLPPIICNNIRDKVAAEKVKLKGKKSKRKDISLAALMESKASQEQITRLPRYPLVLTWSPQQLVFEIFDKPVALRLLIRNPCPRPLLLHCCGLWGEAAGLGAGWVCRPRTVLRVAAGMVAYVYVRATPRPDPPIPRATAGLQLAASHRRDIVIGQFFVPIQVEFHNYIPPALEEEEIDESTEQ